MLSFAGYVAVFRNAALLFTVIFAKRMLWQSKQSPVLFFLKETELFRRVLRWKTNASTSFRSRKSRDGKATGRPLYFFEEPQRTQPPREPYSTLK
jgi:hypothetical protein